MDLHWKAAKQPGWVLLDEVQTSSQVEELAECHQMRFSQAGMWLCHVAELIPCYLTLLIIRPLFFFSSDKFQIQHFEEVLIFCQSNKKLVTEAQQQALLAHFCGNPPYLKGQR